MRIYLFCCSTAVDVERLAGFFGDLDGCEVKTVSLPCSGKADSLYLVKAFETGADGVALVTCRRGECRYLEGNLRAVKRAEAVDDLLAEIGMGKGRLTVIEFGDGGLEAVIESVRAFGGAIAALPAVAGVGGGR